MQVDLEQDIPETASLADVIRHINAERQWQREAPARAVTAIRKATHDVGVSVVAASIGANERAMRREFKQ